MDPKSAGGNKTDFKDWEKHLHVSKRKHHHELSARLVEHQLRIRQMNTFIWFYKAHMIQRASGQVW